MSTPAADLNDALRAAAGVADTDVPRLPPAAITELANETVETIAWTYADASRASAAADHPDARRDATQAGAPPVRGPAAWLPAALRRPLAVHSRGHVALFTALTLAVAVGATLTVSGVLEMSSRTSVDAAGGVTGWQTVPLGAQDAATREAGAACVQELKPHGGGYPDVGLTTNDPLLFEQRGRIGFTVLANAKGFGSCLTLDGRGDGGGIWYAPGYPHPPATGISISENGTAWTMDLTSKRVDTTALAGLAGSAVTGITVRRADGVVVTASVNDGLWAACWLGTAKAVSVTVHTSDGRSKTTAIGKVTTLPPSPRPSVSAH